MIAVPKGTAVDCIYYRGDNALEVLRFCEGKASTSTAACTVWPPIFIRPGNGVCYVVPLNSYIVKEGESFKVYDERTFEREFDILNARGLRG